MKSCSQYGVSLTLKHYKNKLCNFSGGKTGTIGKAGHGS